MGTKCVRYLHQGLDFASVGEGTPVTKERFRGPRIGLLKEVLKQQFHLVSLDRHEIHGF